MSQPIPLRLIRAISLAPELSENRTPGRVHQARAYGVRELDPEALTATLLETLRLVCLGYTNPEIGRRMHYDADNVKGRVRALCAVFDARNRTHLAALAVARGYVELD